MDAATPSPLPTPVEDLSFVVTPDLWYIPWYGYVLGVLLLAAFLVPLYLAFRRKAALKAATAVEPAPDPSSSALERLAKLRANPGGFTARELAVEASAILREYVEARFNIRAPYLTTREFLEGLGRNAAIQPAQLGTVKDFLANCDAAKFAGSAAGPVAFLDFLHQFISDTRPAPPPTVETAPPSGRTTKPTSRPHPQPTHG